MIIPWELSYSPKNSKRMLILGVFEKFVLSAYSTNVSNSPKIEFLDFRKTVFMNFRVFLGEF